MRSPWKPSDAAMSQKKQSNLAPRLRSNSRPCQWGVKVGGWADFLKAGFYQNRLNCVKCDAIIETTNCYWEWWVKMKKQGTALDENSVRVIKISKTALFEFIYEKLIENQDTFFNVDSLDVTSTFDINFERGEFIFCAYKSEDGKGKAVEFPKGIDLQRLMAVLPDTTPSMFADGRYKEYTKEELVSMSRIP